MKANSKYKEMCIGKLAELNEEKDSELEPFIHYNTGEEPKPKGGGIMEDIIIKKIIKAGEVFHLDQVYCIIGLIPIEAYHQTDPYDDKDGIDAGEIIRFLKDVDVNIKIKVKEGKKKVEGK